MSLVSEALRKARQEAAERGAARKGVVIRTTVMLPSRRLGLAPGPAAALGALAVLLVVGAGLAWWALDRNHTESTPLPRGGTATRVASEPAASVKGVAITPPGAPTAPGAQALAAAPAAQPVTAPSAPPASPRPIMVAERVTTPAVVAPPGEGEKPVTAHAEPLPSPKSKESETSPAEARGSGGEVGERSFRLTAVLDDVKLALDYIAYQPSKAFAGINGHEVFVGTVIEGFRVEEIGPDYVRLRDRHGSFYLRSK